MSIRPASTTSPGNSQDGGSFGKLIAELSVDKNGKNALDPAFDKGNVAQDGLVNSRYDGIGQIGWSHLAVENGFSYLGIRRWGGDWNYAAPSWPKRWAGCASSRSTARRCRSCRSATSAATRCSRRKAASTFAGDWQINDYLTNAKFKFAFAPLPTGP